MGPQPRILGRSIRSLATYCVGPRRRAGEGPPQIGEGQSGRGQHRPERWQEGGGKEENKEQQEEGGKEEERKKTEEEESGRGRKGKEGG